MLDQLKAFNAKHNGAPLKVGVAVVSAVAFGTVAVLAYQALSPVTIVDGEFVADVTEAVADVVE